MRIPLYAVWCTLLLLIYIPLCRPDEVPNDAKLLWDRINAPWDTWWELWHGLGACRDDKSLLFGIDDEICRRRRCIISWGVSALIDLDKLHLSDNPADISYDGHLHDCSLPSGGQTRSKNSPKVTFVYTLHGNDAMTARSLIETFRTAHEISSAEFVIVDDASDVPMPYTDRVIRHLKNMFQTDISTITHTVSKGFGASNNVALRHAVGEYAVLLNSDVQVLPGWITLLMRTILTYPGKVGMVGPLQISTSLEVNEAGGLLFRGGLPHNMGRGSIPNKQAMYNARIVDYISAACVLFHRETFLGLGLFDPAFEPAYYEDTDAAVTMYEHGYLTILQPLAVVIHKEGGTISSQTKEDLMKNHKNLFYNKHKSLLDGYCPDRPGNCHQPISTHDLHTHMSFMKQPNRVLVFDLIPPEPDKDAGSIRLTEIFRILQQEGFSITFEPLSTGRHVKYILNILASGINYIYPETVKGMSRYAQEHAPHVPLYSCPWKLIIACRRDVFYNQILHLKRLCPETPIIFDTVDVHFLREERKLAQEWVDFTAQHQNSSRAEKKQGWNRFRIARNSLESMTFREMSLMKLANVTYVVSTTERDLLKEQVPDLDIRVVSNIYDPPPSLPPSDPVNRHGALFVGSMCHPPNIGAVEFIVRSILSNRTFPDGFVMHMVFSRLQECPQDIVQEARAHRLVNVHLDVSNEELEHLHHSVKIVLAPVMYGAGVKGKVNYALLHGVPVVSTTIGAEGMNLVNGASFLLANTEFEFYSAIMSLYTDVSLWHTLREGGLKVMQNYFSRDVAHRTIKQTLQDLKIEKDPPKWQCPYSADNTCPSVLQSHGSIVTLSTLPDVIHMSPVPDNLQEKFRLETMYPWLRNRPENNNTLIRSSKHLRQGITKQALPFGI